MAKFKVWDAVNSSEEQALEVEAADEDEAACLYAEQDSDGMSDGLYLNEKSQPMDNITRDGHPIYVRSASGGLTRWNVGVIEFEPVFYASPRPLNVEEDHCPHGMYFTGPAACPQCSRVVG